MSFNGKTYWLIGASDGLGAALARALDAEDAHLILSARNKDKLVALASELKNAKVLVLDVTNPESVQSATQEAGQVDGIVYLAGAYKPMRAQEWEQAEVRKMFAVNVLGATEVLSHVVPQMSQDNQGHIVLIGSLAGYRGLPGAIGYGASKCALMHLGENLKIDLKNTSIKVQIINPGFIETRLTAKNDFKMPQIMEPNTAATRVLKLMKGRKSVAAFPAPFAWLFTLAKFIPRKIFIRLFG